MSGHDIKLTIHKAKGLKAADSNGKSDPYVKVFDDLDDKKSLGKTKVIKKTLDPVWDQTLQFHCKRTVLRLELFDHDLIGKHAKLGSVTVDVAHIAPDAGPVWEVVQNGTGEIQLSVEFKQPLWDTWSETGGDDSQGSCLHGALPWFNYLFQSAGEVWDAVLLRTTWAPVDKNSRFSLSFQFPTDGRDSLKICSGKEWSDGIEGEAGEVAEISCGDFKGHTRKWKKSGHLVSGLVVLKMANDKLVNPFYAVLHFMQRPGTVGNLERLFDSLTSYSLPKLPKWRDFADTQVVLKNDYWRRAEDKRHSMMKTFILLPPLCRARKGAEGVYVTPWSDESNLLHITIVPLSFEEAHKLDSDSKRLVKWIEEPSHGDIVLKRNGDEKAKLSKYHCLSKINDKEWNVVVQVVETKETGSRQSAAIRMECVGDIPDVVAKILPQISASVYNSTSMDREKFDWKY